MAAKLMPVPISRELVRALASVAGTEVAQRFVFERAVRAAVAAERRRIVARKRAAASNQRRRLGWRW